MVFLIDGSLKLTLTGIVNNFLKAESGFQNGYFINPVFFIQSITKNTKNKKTGNIRSGKKILLTIFAIYLKS